MEENRATQKSSFSTAVMFSGLILIFCSVPALMNDNDLLATLFILFGDIEISTACLMIRRDDKRWKY